VNDPPRRASIVRSVALPPAQSRNPRAKECGSLRELHSFHREEPGACARTGIPLSPTASPGTIAPATASRGARHSSCASGSGCGSRALGLEAEGIGDGETERAPASASARPDCPARVRLAPGDSRSTAAGPKSRRGHEAKPSSARRRRRRAGGRVRVIRARPVLCPGAGKQRR
jgi:hypothetical protein